MAVLIFQDFLGLHRLYGILPQDTVIQMVVNYIAQVLMATIGLHLLIHILRTVCVSAKMESSIRQSMNIVQPDGLFVASKSSC